MQRVQCAHCTYYVCSVPHNDVAYGNTFAVGTRTSYCYPKIPKRVFDEIRWKIYGYFEFIWVCEIAVKDSPHTKDFEKESIYGPHNVSYNIRIVKLISKTNL